MRSDVLQPPTSSKPDSDDPVEVTWSARFKMRGLAALSPTATAVVEADADFITDNCIIEPSNDGFWPSSRFRAGIVVGAVQSGKTASMLAVAARLLDRPTNVIVILAGTRVALWQQTYERLLEQLDGTTLLTGFSRTTVRQFIPKPDAVLGPERLTPTEYTRAAKRQLKRSLKSDRPIIVVIPKQDDHLIAVARALQEALDALPSGPDEKPLHMVVLDDEADDGSVLDVEQSKVMPARIQMLWTGRGGPKTQTCHPRLYATYVAYTATPQANFLQLDSNPLSPRDFCAALRAPAKSGGSATDARQPTYTEALGIKSHYFGGEAWYIPPPAISTTVPFPDRTGFDSDQEHSRAVTNEAEGMTDDAVRAFLVASALRDLQAERKGSLPISEVRSMQTLTKADCERLPPPCGMLSHPASAVDRHWHEARRIIAQANGEPLANYAEATDWHLNGSGWLQELDTNPEAWQRWFREYQRTQTELEDYPGGPELDSLTSLSWEQVAARLRLLFPLVKLRVINSDPKADDRPRYKPQAVEYQSDAWHVPPDLLTVFVSGNVMSRGITLEGLSTSVFSRSSNTPVADTQMQMQRWFGYRGSIAPVLRLFTFQDQRQLFESYHGYDMAMRREICSAMNDGSFESPQLILQGSHALATAKVPTTRLPLSPGATPSVRLVEVGDSELREHNISLVEQALRDHEWGEVTVRGDTKGLLMDTPWTMIEAAEFLEALRFKNHDPQIAGDVRYERWQAIASHLNLAADEGPLLRTPGIDPKFGELNVRSCPYTIAAYLRLWSAALRRNRIDGMSATHRPDTSWSLIRASLPTTVPVRIGITFGSLPPLATGILGERGVRPVFRGAVDSETCTLKTLWGRRGTSSPNTNGHTGNYLGDQRFDYHRVDAPPAPPLHVGGAFWRPANHDALLLIHIVEPRIGEDRQALGVAVGLSLPRGGPEQFAATLTHGT